MLHSCKVFNNLICWELDKTDNFQGWRIIIHNPQHQSNLQGQEEHYHRATLERRKNQPEHQRPENKQLEVDGTGRLSPAKTSIMTDVSSCVSMTFGKECAAEDTKLVGQSTQQSRGSDLDKWGAWVNTWVNKTNQSSETERRESKDRPLRAKNPACSLM